MEISNLSDAMSGKRATVRPSRSLLVGISGIDESGKGFITAKLAEQLTASGLKTAVINGDGSFNLPHIRFSKSEPGRHYYEHALRLDPMFEQLVLPLKLIRSVSLTTDLTEEAPTEYQIREYVYENIDVILLEGIFLFKRQYCDRFDLCVWIDCPFKTALARAIVRSQEGLG